MKIHGKNKKRRWLKIHIGVDAKTQEIVAEATTTSCVGDAKMTAFLLRQVKRQPRTVLADGGYDRTNSRKVIKQCHARALIPPPLHLLPIGSWTSEQGIELPTFSSPITCNKLE